MDVVKFIMTVRRICKNQGCAKCPVCKEGMCMVESGGNSSESIVETISKVEQWAKDVKFCPSDKFADERGN